MHGRLSAGGNQMLEDEKDAMRMRLRQHRPAMAELLEGTNGKDALSRAVDAFVEFEPSLDTRRDQVMALLIASVGALKKEKGEHVATAI
jgi:hypothetical protein